MIECVCLTVQEPWASAIFRCGRDVENRSWSTTHRGALVIHAGKTFESKGFWRALGLDRRDCLPGHALGLVDLAACETQSSSCWALGDQWHWRLRNPRSFSQPFPMRGFPRLFKASIPASVLHSLIQIPPFTHTADPHVGH